jgi:hypothetical protein
MIRYDFLNQKKFVETQRLPIKEDMVIDHQHVFLFGLENQISLKEYLESNRIIFEIHDRDEVKTNNVRKSIGYLDLKEPEPIEEEDNDPKKVKKKPNAPPVKKPVETKKKDEGKKEVKKKKDKKKDYVVEDFEKLPVVIYEQKQFAQSEFFLRDTLNPFSLKYELQGSSRSQKGLQGRG